MGGPRWAPPGQVARTCRRGGWGMCDACDEWADLAAAEDDPNIALCPSCTERIEREMRKSRLKHGGSATCDS